MSPQGSPPRRPGQTWEGGDVGGGATLDRQPLAAAAIVGNPITSPDEGAEFTHKCGTIDISSIAGFKMIPPPR